MAHESDSEIDDVIKPKTRTEWAALVLDKIERDEGDNTRQYIADKLLEFAMAGNFGAIEVYKEIERVYNMQVAARKNKPH